MDKPILGNLGKSRRTCGRTKFRETWGNPGECVGEPNLGKSRRTCGRTKFRETWGNPGKCVGEPSLGNLGKPGQTCGRTKFGKLGETRANVWANQVYERWANPGMNSGQTLGWTVGKPLVEHGWTVQHWGNTYTVYIVFASCHREQDKNTTNSSFQWLAFKELVGVKTIINKNAQVYSMGGKLSFWQVVNRCLDQQQYSHGIGRLTT